MQINSNGVNNQNASKQLLLEVSKETAPTPYIRRISLTTGAHPTKLEPTFHL